MTVRLFKHGPRRPKAAPTSESVFPTVGRALKIVLVEDNRGIRDIVQCVLQHDGHQVTAAADGLEGLATIVDQRPDVALVDLGLPGMDGLQLARRVRERMGRDIYLIVLTGYVRPEDQQAAKDAGFDDYLVKPVDRDDLIQALSRVPVESTRAEEERTNTEAVVNPSL